MIPLQERRPLLAAAARAGHLACLAVAVFAIATLLAMPAHAAPPQDAKAGPEKAEKKDKRAAPDEEAPPEPRNETRTTKDGLSLTLTYYPSTKGKEAVPIVILHEWKGDRSHYKELALYLQSRGHAVVVPDLRGHGGSTELQPPGQAKSTTLAAAKLRKADIVQMVKEDVEEVNTFLCEKNNDGELNIEKLCVVGVEMGATVALNWAALDWGWQPYPTGKKTGQDVKALVLVSPEWSSRGLTIAQALEDNNVRKELSVMLLVGEKDKKAMQTSEKIFNILSRFHPLPPPKLVREKQTLFLIKLGTSLQGYKLLNEPDIKASRYIESFIDARLVEKTFPWEERVKP